MTAIFSNSCDVDAGKSVMYRCKNTVTSTVALMFVAKKTGS